ncbi:MAG: ribonuclease III domain-containing protein [Leptolyngbya sp.]|nr:ribonuclease III domain-containing protein [Leptolyngbya sp.]
MANVEPPKDQSLGQWLETWLWGESGLEWLLRFREVVLAKNLPMATLAMADELLADPMVAQSMVPNPMANSGNQDSRLPAAQARGLSPIALAYMGDAVYELYVRSQFLIPPKRIQDYHNCVVDQVKAERQAEWADHLAPHLTVTEQDVLRWGRNASSRGPKRVDGAIYQKATGLETLIGYLYLTDPERLAQLLGYLNIGD